MYVKWSRILQRLCFVQSLSIFALTDCLIKGNCTALNMNPKTNYQFLHSLNPIEKHLTIMTAGNAALNYPQRQIAKTSIYQIQQTALSHFFLL